MASEPRPSNKSTPEPSDAALVVGARARDGWAEQALFNRHAPWGRGLAQRLLGRSDEADDLLQDAFVRAILHLQELANPQAFAAWFSSLIVRLAQKRLRRQRMLVRLGLRHAEPIEIENLIAPGASPDVVAELSAIYSVISDMAPEERVALVLRRIEGLELAEIAERMRLSLATVKRRLSAAEVRLKRFQDSR